MDSDNRVQCGQCAGWFKAKKDGSPWRHKCTTPPAVAKPKRYCTAPECDQEVTEPGAYRCDDHLCARSTDCAECWETAVSDPAPTVEVMDDTKTSETLAAVNAFLFEDPSPAAPATNASGQPREKTSRSGYLITDPETGEFRRYKNGNIRGFTRCTTLVKAASDTASLTDWKQRNTLIGASKRPDIAARAHGLTHAGNRDELNAIVAELDDIAGAKVAAGVGTEVHELTERWDAGQLAWEDVPPYWRETIKRYEGVLAEKGLRPVPGLIERTVMTHAYGGVAGTFDRIYYHEPSGTYVMGDVKTGQAVDQYGRSEVPAQLAVYTTAFNEYGVYDWNTDSWSRPENAAESLVKVRTDVGVVVHMPVQGDKAHTVSVKAVDLRWGRQVAQQCYEVRRDRSAAPKWEEFDGFGERPALPAGPPLTWESRFAAVESVDDAKRLWSLAKDAELSSDRLDACVLLANEALDRLGVSR